MTKRTSMQTFGVSMIVFVVVAGIIYAIDPEFFVVYLVPIIAFVTVGSIGIIALTQASGMGKKKK